MINDVIRSYCSACRHETKHEILFEKVISGEYDEYEIRKNLIECLGCENISYRIEEHDFWDLIEEYDYDTGQEIMSHRVSVDFFPTALKGHSEIKNLHSIPEQIKSVYDQTMLAFRGKSYLLAGVGFRAIIESICIQENIKGSNLEIKINNLAKNRLISERESERLHTIRFLGNDSVHEMEIPQESKLFLVLDIVENLLKNLYILDSQAKFMLDTIITNYSEFEDVLWQCSENCDQNEEKTIKAILGKHIRRVKIDLANVEKIVISRISSGDIEFLKLGGQKNNNDNTTSQLFTYTGLERIPF